MHEDRLIHALTNNYLLKLITMLLCNTYVKCVIIIIIMVDIVYIVIFFLLFWLTFSYIDSYCSFMQIEVIERHSYYILLCKKTHFKACKSLRLLC